MPVYKDKRTGRYFIQFQKDGERYKQRLPKGMKRSDAEKIELRMQHEHAFAKAGIEEVKESPLFEQFVISVYLPSVDGTPSYVKAVYVCKAAMPFLKGRRMDEILPLHIEEFKRSRERTPTMHSTKRKPATIHRELCILSKIFSMAVDNGYIKTNPLKKVTLPAFSNFQDKVMTPAQFTAMIANMHGEWARDVCVMALLTGLRQNDIFSLTRFECRMDEGKIIKIQGKTTRAVVVEITAPVREILERRIRQHPEGVLFPSPKTSKQAGNGGIRRAMERACKRAKIPVFTIRDLRRTFASWGIEEADAVTVSRALGHTSLRMVQRYARNAELMRKMAESIAERATIVPERKLKKVK